MKQLTLLFVLVVLFGRANSQISCTGWFENDQYGLVVIPVESFDQCDYGPWTLVFEDNFSNNKLDLSRWIKAEGWRRDVDFNNPSDPWATKKSKQYYSPENVYTSDGQAHLLAEFVPNNYYSSSLWNPATNSMQLVAGYNDRESGEFNSKRLFHHGFFEASIRLPVGSGFWPGFWLFEGGPRYNEIDIFEFWNENNSNLLSRRQHMNIQYDFDNDGNSNSCPNSWDAPSGFPDSHHTFGLNWERGKVEWLVDGVVRRTVYRYYTVIGQEVGCQVEGWHQYVLNQIFSQDPMSVYFTFALQHNDGNDPSASILPQTYDIDYFRYYKRIPCQNTFSLSSSSLDLSEKVFNVIKANVINMDEQFEVPGNNQLEMIGGNNVTWSPGFSAKYGSVVTAKIANSCEVSGIAPVQFESKQDQEYGVLRQETFHPEQANEFLVFPNPSLEGSFSIKSNRIALADFNLIITDELGKKIECDYEVSEGIIVVRMRNTTSGIYTLAIYSKPNDLLITHKLVVN